MKKLRRRKRAGQDERRGASLVEFALVLPIIVMVMIGFIEFARAMMVQHTLEEAARAGCRAVIVEGAVKADAESQVAELLGPSGISTYNVEVSDLTLTCNYQPISVTVSTSFKNVSWVPSWFLGSRTLSGTCTMPMESRVGCKDLKSSKSKSKS